MPEKFVATQDGKIYGFGTLSSDAPNKVKVVQYDPATNQTISRADMLVEAHSAGVVALNDGRICVIGGFNDGDGGTFLNTVQVYNPLNDQWDLGEPMFIARDSLATVAIGSEIFTFGGFTEDGGVVRAVNNVQVYNVDTREWSDLTPMPIGRGCLAAIAGGNGNIYTIGGITCYTVASVDEYNRNDAVWNIMTPLSSARWYLAAVALDDKIYAIGGMTRTGDYQPGGSNDIPIANVEEGTLPTELPTVSSAVLVVSNRRIVITTNTSKRKRTM